MFSRNKSYVPSSKTSGIIIEKQEDEDDSEKSSQNSKSIQLDQISMHANNKQDIQEQSKRMEMLLGSEKYNEKEAIKDKEIDINSNGLDRRAQTKIDSEKKKAEKPTINLKSATPAKETINSTFDDPLTLKLKNLDLSNDELEEMMEYMNEPNHHGPNKGYK